MKRQDEGKRGWCEEAMPNIAQQCGLTELALCKHCFLSGVGAYCAAAEEGDAGPPRPWRGDGGPINLSRSYCNRNNAIAIDESTLL